MNFVIDGTFRHAWRIRIRRTVWGQNVGGRSGFKGYLLQTGVSLLEALENDQWDSFGLEPLHEHDRVDVLWTYSNGDSKRIQVKSSINIFTEGQVRRIANDLQEVVKDDSLELVLVGKVADELIDVKSLGRVKLQVCEVGLDKLFDDAASLVSRYWRLRGEYDLTIDMCNVIARALFTKLSVWSTEGRHISRSDFSHAINLAIWSVVTGNRVTNVEIVANQWLSTNLSHVIEDEARTLLKYPEMFSQSRTTDIGRRLSKIDFLGSRPTPAFRFHRLSRTQRSRVFGLVEDDLVRRYCHDSPPISIACPGAIFTSMAILSKLKKRVPSLEIRNAYVDSMQMVNEILIRKECPADILIMASAPMARLLCDIKSTDYVLFAPWHRIDHRIMVPTTNGATASNLMNGEFYFLPTRHDVPSSPSLVFRNLRESSIAQKCTVRTSDLHSGEAILRNGDKDVRLIRWCGAWRLDTLRNVGFPLSLNDERLMTDMVLVVHKRLLSDEKGERMRVLHDLLMESWLDLCTNDNSPLKSVSLEMSSDPSYIRLISRLMGYDIPVE